MSKIHIPFTIVAIFSHIKYFLPRIHPLLIKFDIYVKINKWIEINMSRKLILLYVVLSIATLGAFFPPFIIWFLTILGRKVVSFEILGSTEWITIVSLLVTTYFGVNHMDNRLAINNNIAPKDLGNVVSTINNSQQLQKNNSQPDTMEQDTLAALNKANNK